MAIYMEYQGIQGNVTAEGYENMIKLDFAQFEVKRKVNMMPGAMSNRESSTPSFSVIRTGKKLERSTSPILKEVFSGSAGKDVKLHFVRTGPGKLEEIFVFTLADCLPTFYRVVITQRDGCIPTERLYLSYSSIMISHTVKSANNKTAATLRQGYDLSTAMSM